MELTDLNDTAELAEDSKAMEAAEAAEDFPLYLRYWLLRLLVPMRKAPRLIGEHGFTSETIANGLGLERWTSQPEPDVKAVHAALRRQYRKLVAGKAHAETPPVLAANVRMLAELVKLTPVEARLLEFTVLMQSDGVLIEAVDWLGNLSTLKLYRDLATWLELNPASVRAALDVSGVLSRSGLLTITRYGAGSLASKLELLSADFADRMITTVADPQALLKDVVAAGVPATLELADFRHVGGELALMRAYLDRVLDTRRRGVNVLVYGPPGTGKTELARAMAASLNVELFEVASADNDGDAISGSRRLRVFNAVQCCFNRGRTMILFDEVEDVFEQAIGSAGAGPGQAQKGKAWINRLLEENAVPTIWLSNSIRCVDAAFVRRFDFVMELPVPTESRRREIIEQACDGLLDARQVARLATCADLAPAVIARAAHVARTACGDTGVVAGAIETMVGNTLEAQGHARPRRAGADALSEVYDPAFVQCDADLAQAASGLVRTRAGRLCLYGPPGTGKTAWGRWLAREMDCPLLVKRASDLMSKWVGDSEKLVARAFLEAERDGAVLLIDEVDSFLQDRRGAQRSWELTLVNEMLTQMESFPGVFIASTNLMDNLDPAALRRFDLKLKFGYLQVRQAQELFRRYCLLLQLGEATDADLRGVAGLVALTPGDFAAVARRHRFSALRGTAGLMAALADECAVKAGLTRSIGFLPNAVPAARLQHSN